MGSWMVYGRRESVYDLLLELHMRRLCRIFQCLLGAVCGALLIAWLLRWRDA